MYQLVVLDLDMTIIDRNLAIPPRTRQVVADLRTAGVKVMIATGRMFCSARPFALQLGLHDMPLIAYNGALVKDVASGATLYHRPLDLSVAKAVARLAEEWGVHWQAYLDDRLYVRALNEKARRYMQIAAVPAHPVGNLHYWLSAPPTKVLIFEDPPVLAAFSDEVRKQCPGQVHITTSAPYFLEITGPGVSKRAAVQALLTGYGLEPQQVLAAGDSFNDLELLEYVGCGVAMGSAPQEVQARADYVTGNVAADGLAIALERLVLGRDGIGASANGKNLPAEIKI